jgi:hypothetical protein
VRLVGQRKAHFHGAVGARDRIVHHQPADAEAAVFRRLARLELGRAVVVEDVLVHGLEQESGAQADTGKDQANGKRRW